MGYGLIPKYVADTRPSPGVLHVYKPTSVQCKMVKSIPKEHRVYFDNVSTAQGYGFDACDECLHHPNVSE